MADFYGQIAALYNQDWGRAYLGTACSHFDEYLAPELPAGSAILDVCCGTGQLAAALTARGYQVTGVDLAPEMLVFARENAPQAEFVAGEMAEFGLGRTFAAAVCCFNSLNHATSVAHLQAALANVSRHLTPGAPLLADLLLAQGFAQSWESRASGEAAGAHCELDFRYHAGAPLATCTATLTGEGPLQTVRMSQQIYTLREIKQAFRAARFTVERVIPVRGGLPAKGRVAIVGRKG